MASQAPRKKPVEKKPAEKKPIPGMKKKKDKPEKPKKEDEEEDENEILKAPPSNIIDGRVFEADRELALTKEEEKEMEEFQAALKKYHKMSKEMRKEALVAEKKDLKESDKSPKDKHYEGTRVDRIKNIDLETEILENMIKLDEEKGKDT